jgi:hypothetical protein
VQGGAGGAPHDPRARPPRLWFRRQAGRAHHQPALYLQAFGLPLPAWLSPQQSSLAHSLLAASSAGLPALRAALESVCLPDGASFASDSCAVVAALLRLLLTPPPGAHHVPTRLSTYLPAAAWAAVAQAALASLPPVCEGVAQAFFDFRLWAAPLRLCGSCPALAHCVQRVSVSLLDALRLRGVVTDEAAGEEAARWLRRCAPSEVGAVGAECARKAARAFCKGGAMKGLELLAESADE